MRFLESSRRRKHRSLLCCCDLISGLDCCQRVYIGGAVMFCWFWEAVGGAHRSVLWVVLGLDCSQRVSVVLWCFILGFRKSLPEARIGAVVIFVFESYY